MITEDKCWPEPALPPCVLREKLPSMHHTVTLAKARGLGQLTKGHAPVPQACLLPETRCPAAVAVASSPAYVQEGPAYSCLYRLSRWSVLAHVASGHEPSDQDKVVKRQTKW